MLHTAKARRPRVRSRLAVLARRMAMVVGVVATLGVFAASASASPFVFVANHNDDTASQYAVGAGGALTPDTPATVATGIGPGNVSLSPDGSSFYITNGFSDTVSQFDVSAGGTLTPKTPRR